MITLPLYDQDIGILGRALLELRNGERDHANALGPLHSGYEPALRVADRAYGLLQRLEYATRVGCRCETKRAA